MPAPSSTVAWTTRATAPLEWSVDAKNLLIGLGITYLESHGVKRVEANSAANPLTVFAFFLDHKDVPGITRTCSVCFWCTTIVNIINVGLFATTQAHGIGESFKQINPLFEDEGADILKRSESGVRPWGEGLGGCNLQCGGKAGEK